MTGIVCLIQNYCRKALVYFEGVKRRFPLSAHVIGPVSCPLTRTMRVLFATHLNEPVIVS